MAWSWFRLLAVSFVWESFYCCVTRLVVSLALARVPLYCDMRIAPQGGRGHKTNCSIRSFDCRSVEPGWPGGVRAGQQVGGWWHASEGGSEHQQIAFLPRGRHPCLESQAESHPLSQLQVDFPSARLSRWDIRGGGALCLWNLCKSVWAECGMWPKTSHQEVFSCTRTRQKRWFQSWKLKSKMNKLKRGKVRKNHVKI